MKVVSLFPLFLWAWLLLLPFATEGVEVKLSEDLMVAASETLGRSRSGSGSGNANAKGAGSSASPKGVPGSGIRCMFGGGKNNDGSLVMDGKTFEVDCPAKLGPAGEQCEPKGCGALWSQSSGIVRRCACLNGDVPEGKCEDSEEDGETVRRCGCTESCCNAEDPPKTDDDETTTTTADPGRRRRAAVSVSSTSTYGSGSCPVYGPEDGLVCWFGADSGGLISRVKIPCSDYPSSAVPKRCVTQFLLKQKETFVCGTFKLCNNDATAWGCFCETESAGDVDDPGGRNYCGDVDDGAEKGRICLCDSDQCNRGTSVDGGKEACENADKGQGSSLKGLGALGLLLIAVSTLWIISH